jgi:AbrB family looped-hinge helix DNA binding protein
MTTATLTSKGQITIPKTIREQMMLHTGDKLDFTITETGNVLLIPVTRHVKDVFGRLNRPGQGALTPADMDNAIQQRMMKSSL